MQILKHKIGLSFFLVAVFFALPVGNISASVSECDYSQKYDNEKTIYIEASGSDDQNGINAAIEQIDGVNKTSVFMKEGEYVLSGSINMKDTSILEGDRGTVVTIPDHAAWKSGIPLITAPNGSNNIEIKCFEMDGNYDNNTSQTADSCYRPLSWNSDFSDCESKTDDRLVGRNYYNMAVFTDGRNLSMHDMYLHDGAGDGFRVNQGTNLKFYDNLVYKLGHDAVYYSASVFGEVWRNRITIRTDAGARADNSNNISIHDNVIEAYDHWSAGGAGIQILKDERGTTPMNKIQIYNNTLHHTFGPGIQIGATGTYGRNDAIARIHHNIFYETGLNYSTAYVGGIVTSGFYDLQIENNTFDKVYNYGIVGMVFAKPVSASGYVANIKNNIIARTQYRRNSAGGSTNLGGVGIANLVPDTHTFNVSYTDLWMNVSLPLQGQSFQLSNNIEADPLFVNMTGHDYHLSAGSPAIDAGDPASDFSREPAPNGGRIDMGRYGNTSGAAAGSTGAAAVISSTSGSDGTGSGNEATMTGSGGSGSGAGSESTVVTPKEQPSYWDPGAAVTDASYTVAGEAALAPEEQALAALFGPQGSSAPTATAECSAVEGGGGLIPCGRNTNSSETAWNECDDCDLCSIVLMGQLVIEFIVKIAGLAATLAIILSGFLYIFAAGEMALIAKSKLMMKYTIIGFIIIFAAWAMVDSLLLLLGYIDPIDGEWHTIC